jgi:hypothetical protein
MTEFMSHEAHYADTVDQRRKTGGPPFPWTSSNDGVDRVGVVCPWTRDFLSAEWLRRNPQPWSYT